MGKHLKIGVIIGNANAPHTRNLMRGICDAAKSMDVNVVFFLGVHMANYYHEYFGEKMENRHDFQYNIVYDYAKIVDVDGLIIAYGSLGFYLEDKDKNHFLDRFKGIPYVIVEEYDDRHVGSSVISDNYNGMFRIVEHLITVHNYRKFMFVSGPKDNTDAVERELAFRNALAKYQIPFDEDCYAEGDFSLCCNKQIGELLDRHPDAEALVCANDVMAETAYRECAQRSIVVGKDLAITGYDDWVMADSMTPPLTTVLQNELDMGYICVKNIVELCNGKEPVDIVVPAEIKVRASCGCTVRSAYHFPKAVYAGDVIEGSYIDQVADCFCERVMLSQVSNDRKREIKDYIKKILQLCCDAYMAKDSGQIDRKILRYYINEMLIGECGDYISVTALLEGVNAYIFHLTELDQNNEYAHFLLEMEGALLQFIQSTVLKRNDEKGAHYERDTMFIPLVSSDMLSNMQDEVAFYKCPMQIMKLLHAKSAYLYILDRPYRHLYGDSWKCPSQMYLASCYEDGVITSYEPNKRPIINTENGKFVFARDDRRRILTGFNLFQGMYQYGLLLLEIDAQDMLLMHLVSMQISNSLNYFDMYKSQMDMQNQLGSLVEEVAAKNKILGFISEYDEMTGLLNRRGFMEKAMEFIHRDNNERGILLIADLDHLKEINDCFGHVAGDFAIQSAARLLMKALGEDTTIARIGGDEFVALLPYESDMSGDAHIRHLSRVCAEFNRNTRKEFYVELSAGYAVFMCGADVDFNAILASSDERLYEAKKTRRKSIKKIQ